MVRAQSYPRLQVKSVDEYVDRMNNLNLPNPKMMDVVVPANLRIGFAQSEVARRGWAILAPEALAAADRSSRNAGAGEARRSLHAPYTDLLENIRPSGMVHELARTTGKRIVFYCAFGERSAMAVQAAQDAGLVSACHIEGGLGAWWIAFSRMI
jgi:sulfur dioxygenase